MPGGAAHRIEPAPPSQPMAPASVAIGAGRHASHRNEFAPPNPVSRQNGVAPLQSAFATHSTHAFLVVLQTVAPPSAAQPALVRHPGVQAPARQMGPAAELAQSLFAAHSTQRFIVSQTRAPPSRALQSVAVRHWTQRWVVMSQTGRGPPPPSGVQSDAVEHPTHAPVARSQWFSAPTHVAAPPSTAQEAWHV
jgi:hypothetical protein